jgi:hypothetical protein
MIFDNIQKGTKIEYKSILGSDKGICILKDDEKADFATDSGAGLQLRRAGFKKTIESFEIKEIDKSVKLQCEGFSVMMSMVEGLFNMMSPQDQLVDSESNWVNSKETKEDKLNRLLKYLKEETEKIPELKPFKIEYKINAGFINVNGILKYRRTFFSIGVSDENSFTISIFSPGRGSEDIEFRDKDMIVALEYVKRHVLSDWKKYPFFIMYMFDKKMHGLVLKSEIIPHSL